MKKHFIILLAVCLCTVATLTACTGGRDNESSAGSPSKAPTSSAPEASKGENSSPVSIPEVSVNVSDMSIIPNTSDMFQDGSTIGDYSNGILQESEAGK